MPHQSGLGDDHRNPLRASAGGHFRQSFHTPYPVRRLGPALHIRLEENVIPGRIEKYVPVKDPVILIDLSGAQVIRSDDAGDRILFGKACNEVGLLRIYAAAHLYHARILLHSASYLPESFQFQHRFIQRSYHSSSCFRL